MANKQHKLEPPYYPIIYVRGFAGTENEIENTVADPYMGFNLGSTKFRQAWTGAVHRHYFESPLYRLTKDFEYSDVYTNGMYMPPNVEVPSRSVVIYRYYDQQFFEDLDAEDDGLPPLKIKGQRRDIEDFAAGLAKLICRVRDRICKGDKQREAAFKVHLVGHSMGGLIIRSFLQYVGQGGQAVQKRFGVPWEKLFKQAKKLVDKVFTYATPHRGIDLRVVGNVPSFFSALDADNFAHQRMRAYLNLPGWSGEAVDNLYGRFDPNRFFCLVGTNHQDYAVLYGWSRRLVGPMSDGLVRIANATVHSQSKKGAATTHAPRAFVHRSHSGHFGIVNSEEGYQNLTRFLFGNVRVDGVLDIDSITLPDEVQAARAGGDQVRASYHFEVIVRTRGMTYDLHRRTTAEESAIFRRFDELFPKSGKPRSPHLFSTFLSDTARVNDKDPSLGFAIDLSILVPEYTIERNFWFDKHYNGSHLLRVTVFIEATPPNRESPGWQVKYGMTPKQIGEATEEAKLKKVGQKQVVEIPVANQSKPGFKGKLRLIASEWK